MRQTEIDPKLPGDPVFKRALEDSLAMQDRFSAEPAYDRTGKGSLKSEGVGELQMAKGARQSKQRIHCFGVPAPRRCW